jgi:hypothetical protein
MSAETQSRHSSAPLWVAGVALVVVLYLLSPGLLVHLEEHWHYRLPSSWNEPMSVAYAPLQVSMRFEPIRDAYSAYFSWCAGRPVSIPAPPP